MERREFMVGLGLAAGLAATPLLFTNCSNPKETTTTDSMLQKGAIQHMVIFDLKHEAGSAEAIKFLKDSVDILTPIPGVQQFQAFNQVSSKNDFSYGFSMVFADQQAYDGYNIHPDHVAYVEERFKTEVTRFLEIDFAVPELG
jgi:hypothetical protein